MSFSALRALLPALPADGELAGAWPKIGRGGNSFSDDLSLGGRQRLGVRLRITDREGGGYCIDLRDCDDALPDRRFALSAPRALTACLLAIGDATGHSPHLGWASRIELLTDPHTWIGGEDSTDFAAIAHGMARTYDTLLGALGNAGAGKVGAGSCSLGAIVELREPGAESSAEAVLTEVLPGGEGGQPTRAGRSAYAGPILPNCWDQPATIEGVTIEGELRQGSGGHGKQMGGCGVIRRYRIERPLVARVAFDRVDNPPHGVERAGPPLGTVVTLQGPGDTSPQTVLPWTDLPLGPGACLTVQTCGGAGWGFPGYGEIEWDPSEWFGSQSKKPPQ